MITLDGLNSALHSVEIANAAGDALDIDASGKLSVKIEDNGNSITVDAVDLDIRDLAFATDKVDVSGSSVEVTPSAYDTWSVSAETVDTTAGGVQLVSTPLTGRLRVEIQNLGTQDIYIRNATGVTAANGLKIPKGTSYQQDLDDGAAIWAIAASGSSDVRVAEYAA